MKAMSIGRVIAPPATKPRNPFRSRIAVAAVAVPDFNAFSTAAWKTGRPSVVESRAAVTRSRRDRRKSSMAWKMNMKATIIVRAARVSKFADEITLSKICAWYNGSDR